jgi:hypothetical protein
VPRLGFFVSKGLIGRLFSSIFACKQDLLLRALCFQIENIFTVFMRAGSKLFKIAMKRLRQRVVIYSARKSTHIFATEGIANTKQQSICLVLD